MESRAGRQTDRQRIDIDIQTSGQTCTHTSAHERTVKQTGRQADRQRNDGTLNEINALPVPYSDRFMLEVKIH